MSVRIGIAVASDAVRAVCVRDSAVIWAGRSPLGGDVTIDTATVRLLDGMKLPRWPHPRVVVAVGPRHAQTKRLTGLPALGDTRALAKVVSEGAGRFFLKNGVALSTTGVRLTAPGEGWASAIEEPIVRELTALCRRRRLTLVGFVPSVAVVARGLTGDTIAWTDGDVVAELALEKDTLAGMRRLPRGGEGATQQPIAAAPLASLGADAWQYADAYGAAVSRPDDAHLLRAGSTAGEEPVIPRMRWLLAGAALSLALVAAIVAPGVAALRSAGIAREAIAAMAALRGASAREETELRHVTAALAEAGAFAAQRRSPMRFLAALTSGIPPEVQLVTLRLDSAGGNLVALATRAGQVVAQLEEMPDVSAPEVVGPVTREQIGGREKERVAVRFRWAASGQRAARETTGREVSR